MDVKRSPTWHFVPWVSYNTLFKMTIKKDLNIWEAFLWWFGKKKKLKGTVQPKIINISFDFFILCYSSILRSDMVGRCSKSITVALLFYFGVFYPFYVYCLKGLYVRIYMTMTIHLLPAQHRRSTQPFTYVTWFMKKNYRALLFKDLNETQFREKIYLFRWHKQYTYMNRYIKSQIIECKLIMDRYFKYNMKI